MLARFIPRGFGITPSMLKLNERSQPTKIHHVIDIKKLLGVGNLDDFINNTSF